MNTGVTRSPSPSRNRTKLNSLWKIFGRTWLKPRTNESTSEHGHELSCHMRYLEFLVCVRPFAVEQAAALLTCVLDVHISSFDGIPTIKTAVSWFSSVPPGIWLASTGRWFTTVSFCIFPIQYLPSVRNLTLLSGVTNSVLQQTNINWLPERLLASRIGLYFMDLSRIPS